MSAYSSTSGKPLYFINYTTDRADAVKVIRDFLQARGAQEVASINDLPVGQGCNIVVIGHGDKRSTNIYSTEITDEIAITRENLLS